MAMHLSPAEEAVEYILRRMLIDGAMAYLMGYGTESYARLTRAHADTFAQDVEIFREDFWRQCQTAPIIRTDLVDCPHPNRLTVGTINEILRLLQQIAFSDFDNHAIEARNILERLGLTEEE